jgi:hypothetical protein
MWQFLLQDWNGISIFLDPYSTPAHDMELFTDASRMGFAGYFQGKWFSEHWPNNVSLTSDSDISMTFCELYPIVVAAILWGHSWSGKRVLFYCDNSGTVHTINKGRSKSPKIMGLMRRLVLVAAHHSFAFSSTHVAGTDNSIADALSRFQEQRFRQLAPSADLRPCTVPGTVMFA